MARHKPDIDSHLKALGNGSGRVVWQLRELYRTGYRPSTVHLRGADYRGIIDDLRGAGFDVARGVVFKGIPVKPFNAS